VIKKPYQSFLLLGFNFRPHLVGGLPNLGGKLLFIHGESFFGEGVKSATACNALRRNRANPHAPAR